MHTPAPPPIRADVHARFRHVVARAIARVDQERAEELAKRENRRAAQWKVRRPGEAAIPSADGAD
jgi:hypothetical protein